MRYSSSSFFIDKKNPAKLSIHVDKEEPYWPITLRISSSNSFPYIAIFMNHDELMNLVKSFQDSFDSYVTNLGEDYKVEDNSNG
jgi:hypothetical protein